MPNKAPKEDESSVAQLPREMTIFEKIVAGELEADIIYEDDLAMAFKDINPVANVHFLVIPKKKMGLTKLSDSKEGHKLLLGHLLYVVSQVAA